MARVLAVVPDLMLGSKVEEMLRSSGHEVERVAEVPAASDADALVIDLEVADAAAAAALGPAVLGFYSHVDAEAKGRAEAAGVTLAVPRSRMARELPALVASLLADA